MGSNQDVTFNLTQLFDDPVILRDADAKFGKVYFTKEQKVELAKLVGTPVWEILKTFYVKQRLVQIAIAGLNVAQNVESLMYEKGKAAEANQFVKEIESVVKTFNEEEKSAKAPKS